MKAAYLASLYSILAGFRQDRQACTFTSGQRSWETSGGTLLDVNGFPCETSGTGRHLVVHC